MPWPGGSVDWSIVPYNKRLRVRSPVRAHAWVCGFSPWSEYIWGGNWSTDVSLSLSHSHSLPPLFSSLRSINIYSGKDFKKKERNWKLTHEHGQQRILKSAKEKQLVTYKAAPIMLSADFSTETADHKGLSRNIQNDEKQEPTTKIILPSGAII